MTAIIGITGFAGSGKDTLAASLERVLSAHGYSVGSFSYADPIRLITNDIGLGIYCRDLKEVNATLLFDDFEEELIEAINRRLAHVTTEDERAQLFAFFCEALIDQGHLHYGPAGNTLHISPRRFAQLLGTEGGRRIDPDFWVTKTKSAIDLSKVDYAIIADVRFPNELAPLDKLWARSRGVAPVAPHESEQYIPELVKQADVVLGDCELQSLDMTVSIALLGI